jgi:hypothetical protein
VSTHPEFGGLDNAALGALVLELASQLHVERTRRLALEAALADAGLVTPATIETTGGQAALREQAAKAADQSIRKLLRVLSDSKDERVPLRAESARATGDT